MCGLALCREWNSWCSERNCGEKTRSLMTHYKRFILRFETATRKPVESGLGEYNQVQVQGQRYLCNKENFRMIAFLNQSMSHFARTDWVR